MNREWESMHHQFATHGRSLHRSGWKPKLQHEDPYWFRPKAAMCVFDIRHLACLIALITGVSCLATTPPPPGYVDASQIPGHPFNTVDATDAFQSALDTFSPKIWVPDMGTEWFVNPITLRSNQEILFESGVVVAAKPGSLSFLSGQLFVASGISNACLVGYGATLRMQQADYLNPPYTPSEFRHGLLYYDSVNIEIIGVTVEDTGGDGITIGTISTSGFCKNMLIKDVTISNAYRNGISVVSAEDLVIDNAVIVNTSGTSPQVGIDFEPDFNTERLVNVVVRNCIIAYNNWSGISFPTSGLLGNGGVQGIPITGSIEKTTIVGNGFDPFGGGGTSEMFGDGIYMKWHLDGVEVKDSLFVDNAQWGFEVDGFGIGYLQDADYSAFWSNDAGPVGRQAGLGTGTVTNVQPIFASTDVNDPFFMYLAGGTSTAITEGASDGSHMGARPVVPGAGVPVVPAVNIEIADTPGVFFNSVTGMTYQLESTPDLVSSNYSDTGAFVVGNGGSMMLFDPMGPTTSKNYRVVVAP
jgi:hypothetical protein